jgi:hypothetical protein
VLGRVIAYEVAYFGGQFFFWCYGFDFSTHPAFRDYPAFFSFDCGMHKLAVFGYPSGAKVSWGGKECPFIPLAFVFDPATF